MDLKAKIPSEQPIWNGLFARNLPSIPKELPVAGPVGVKVLNSYAK